jgi:hypothetical protein
MSDPRERVTPQMYARLFVGHHEGVLILEDLVRRFYDVDLWARGPEGQRETDRAVARREVVHHILRMVGQVDQPDTNAELPPAA